MTRTISTLIVTLFAALLALGCSASLSTDARDAKQAKEALAAERAKSAKLEARLTKLEADASSEDSSSLEAVKRAAEDMGLLGGNEQAEESDAKPSRRTRRSRRPQRRLAANPRVCGMTGPSVGYVFANMDAAKGFAKATSCNGMCYFLKNLTGSLMSVRVNRRAVTLCLDSRTPSEAIPIMRTVVGESVPDAVSVAPPKSVVVIGKFHGPASFQVELHDRLDLETFVTHSGQAYGKTFPSGSRNGWEQPVIALRPRNY